MITLRSVTEDDLETLYEHQREPDANAMAAFEGRDRGAFYAHWRSNVLGNDEVVARAVMCDGRVAGTVFSYPDKGRQLVGYWIGKEFWGRGIATAALRLLLDEVTRRPLHAFVATGNAGSIRVLEKCGFVRIGDRLGTHGEARVSEHVYELTDPTAG